MSVVAGDASRARLQSLAVFLFFCALSLFVFGRSLLGHPGEWFMGERHDPSLYIWSMVWWPYALSHRLNPFLTKMVWYPDGFNLAWATITPIASWVAAPVTAMLGPIASFNLLCMLMPALAAWACYALCRHITGRLWPSVFGGYLFGFSPFMLNHEVLGQLHMLGAFPVPLVVLAGLRHLDGKMGRPAFVATLAALLVCEFLLSAELFASLSVMGAVALGLAFFIDRPGLGARLRPLLPPIAIGCALAAAIMSPYLYYMLAFGVPRGPIMSPGDFSADLLNFIVPTPVNAIGGNWLLRAIAHPFIVPKAEAAAYIAPPLFAIGFLYWREHRSGPLCKILLVFAALCAIAALGPALRVAGWRGPALPWKLFRHIPLLKNMLPVRLCLYLSLDVAVIAAIWIASTSRSLLAKRAFAAATILFTLPNLSSWAWHSTAVQPAFFSQGLYRRYLAKDEVVLTIPFGNRGDCMIWQALSHMYFRMADGHTAPGLIDSFQQWPAATALFFQTALPGAADQLKAFLATHGIGAIIVDEREPGWWQPMVSTLALTPVHTGGVLLYRIPAAELAPYRDANPIDYESRFDQSRFATLVIAADRYWSHTGTIRSLTPRMAEQLGLLPGHWVADFGNKVHTANGLWLGPWGADAVSAGIDGSYEALRPVIEKYRADARAVYFPFPTPLTGTPRGNTFMRKLVMVFDREGLARAAAKAALGSLRGSPGAAEPPGRDALSR